MARNMWELFQVKFYNNVVSIIQTFLTVQNPFFFHFAVILRLNLIYHVDLTIWHNVPQKFYLGLILPAIVHPDGDHTIFSRALLDTASIQQGCGSVL